MDKKIKEELHRASVVVAGGYGMKSKENFALLHKLAELIGGCVGATRAAIDAGLTEKERMIGVTGAVVKPKLFIACGISGAVEHRNGMKESTTIISINTDPDAPINAISDYIIVGDAADVVSKIIKHYKSNKKQ